MSKLIIFLAIAFLVYLLVRAVKADKREPPPVSQQQPMVKCCYCGTYLPAAEAIVEGEAAYCSDEHQKLDHRP